MFFKICCLLRFYIIWSGFLDPNYCIMGHKIVGHVLVHSPLILQPYWLLVSYILIEEQKGAMVKKS